VWFVWATVVGKPGSLILLKFGYYCIGLRHDNSSRGPTTKGGHVDSEVDTATP